MKNITNDRLLKITISTFGWIAILLQFYLIILNRATNVPETIIRYFSFFTIQTNILVVICFTYLIFKPNSKFGLFFQKPQNITAITLYIIIVGIVYNTVLRFLWTPTKYQKLVDELLHSVIPSLVLLYWLIFVVKSNVFYKNILPWLIFPSFFLIYTLIRGYFVNHYPYPFLDVAILGYKKVLINSFYMVLTFLFFGSILVFVSKKMSKKKLYHL